jgi:alkylation response protein AidB-like acyl-CoA dehydrogenase
MDFTFDQEQQMLQETTRRYLQKNGGFEARRARLHQPLRHTDAIWQGLAEMGLLALTVPPEFDGLGCGPVETMLVMQVVGEHLLLQPYAASAVVASGLIDALGDQAQRAALLPSLALGQSIAVLAHAERGADYGALTADTSATLAGGHYLLNGHKCVIAHALSADVLLVTARSDKDGQLAVFVVPSTAPGVRLLPCPLVDGTLAADIFLDQVSLPMAARLGSGDAGAALSMALDRGLAALCAEAVGALDKMLAATAEYCRTRRQFGVQISSFQSLRHRLADMLMHVEQARSMSYLAAVRSIEPDAAERASVMSAAKVVIGQACRFVGQQSVQLHGGMGVTDELDVSHYFRRLMAIELQGGSTDQHLEAYAAQLA